MIIEKHWQEQEFIGLVLEQAQQIMLIVSMIQALLMNTLVPIQDQYVLVFAY
jgi:hypothetical protein